MYLIPNYNVSKMEVHYQKIEVDVWIKKLKIKTKL